MERVTSRGMYKLINLIQLIDNIEQKPTRFPFFSLFFFFTNYTKIAV